MPLTIEENVNNEEHILIVKPYDKMFLHDLQIFILKFEYYILTYEKFKCIFDLRDMQDSPLDLTLKLAQFMKKNRSKIKKTLLCSIIIVNNNLTKNFLNVLFSIVEPASPYYITNNIGDIQHYIYVKN